MQIERENFQSELHKLKNEHQNETFRLFDEIKEKDK